MQTRQHEPAQARHLGRRGEDEAVEYLIGQGWHLLDRNWRCTLGELDVVALDPVGDLVFVEVKCRSGTGFGDPVEAVTAAKVARLRRLAGQWVASRGSGGRPVRLDVIGIVKVRGERARFTHLRGVS